MSLLLSINWPSLVTSWFVVQKIYSKMHLVSCTNTHRDVTDLVNHRMVKNTKTWISWEQNITFLRNKKILNLCLRWHNLRSYRFVTEVAFRQWNYYKNSNLLPLLNPLVLHFQQIIATALANSTNHTYWSASLGFTFIHAFKNCNIR